MAFGLEVKTLRLQTNVFPHPHRHGWKKNRFAGLGVVLFQRFSLFSILLLLLFFSSTGGTTAPYIWHRSPYWSLGTIQNRGWNRRRRLFLHIVRWSKGEEKRGSGVYKIKGWGRGRERAHLSWRGWEVGSPSPTPRVGHRPWPLTPLWKKGI